jgi:antitoxin MazE
MESRVKKWGNSLGVRIPRTLAKQAGIAEDVVVDLSIEANQIIIRKAKTYQLATLLAQVTPSNKHDEIDTGTRIGKEVW